jgi:hypothetical protein
MKAVHNKPVVEVTNKMMLLTMNRKLLDEKGAV